MSPEPSPDVEDSQDVEENATGNKKPGSKAQGRKRTKTGCLSEFSHDSISSYLNK
jgi:hypothetical protein